MPAFVKTANSIALKLLLLLISISVFVPFSPKMPNATLDSSWAVGLNEAIAQGFSFGKEILFTLGPYSSIYTKSYHPATDFMMIAGSLYLALAYWFALVLLVKGTRWILAFCVLLLGMIYARDALFFSYPLLAGILSFKLVSQQKQPPIMIALLFAPFGLYALIKGSSLILSVTVALLCSVFFISKDKRSFAVICLLTPVISMLLFWYGAGQSVVNLPHYVVSTVLLSNGFTQAMSTVGDASELIVYLITAAFLLATIAWSQQISRVDKFFFLALFFVFLFISFKAGFTRHYGHAFIPGTAILIAAMLLPSILNTKMSLLVIFCALTSWYYINNHYTSISLTRNFVSTYSAAWHGFKSRIKDSRSLPQDFDISMALLNQQANFPVFQGTTDIYPSNLSYLIASKNNWLPRPVFQSYSVFTAFLAQENRKHLLGRNSPDTIIFKIEPIDNRVPSLEDGLSWPLLLANYQPTDLKNNYLFLRKKIAPQRSVTQSISEKHKLGETVVLPEQRQLIFAEFKIKPTVLGRLATILLKPTELKILFNLNNGEQRVYRLIANMAEPGFLLSPLIENTTEFTLLYGKKNYLREKMVRSFVVAAEERDSWFWTGEYGVDFKLSV